MSTYRTELFNAFDATDSDCDHPPVCTCTATDDDRADELRTWVSEIQEEWPDVRLMPLDDDDKQPAIRGRCGLDSDEARKLLHTPEEAIEAVRDGHPGFFVYAHKEDHGTRGMVIADRDDTETWPALGPTLRVISGSWESDHLYFINSGNVRSAVGTGQADGEIKAEKQAGGDGNAGCVVPGSIHPSGGVYVVADTPGCGTLRAEDLPDGLRPGSTGGNSGNEEIRPAESPVDPREVLDTENAVGITLREMMAFSEKLDGQLTHQNPGNDYPSISEADMGTVGLLLAYHFEEADVARIMRAFRPRWKVTDRADYLDRTIRRTSVDRQVPKALLWNLVKGSVIDDTHDRLDDSPPVTVETVTEAAGAASVLDDPFTVADVVDSGRVDWGDAGRGAVMRRVRRALKVGHPWYLRMEKRSGVWYCRKTGNFEDLL